MLTGLSSKGTKLLSLKTFFRIMLFTSVESTVKKNSNYENDYVTIT